MVIPHQRQGEAGHVVHLQHADDGDGAEGRHPLGHADQVAAARAARGEKIRDRAHQAPGRGDQGEDDAENDDDDPPVPDGQVHRGPLGQAL